MYLVYREFVDSYDISIFRNRQDLLDFYNCNSIRSFKKLYSDNGGLLDCHCVIVRGRVSIAQFILGFI